MELKKCWIGNKYLNQNNTRIIEKNGAKEMRNAKGGLNTKSYSNNW